MRKPAIKSVRRKSGTSITIFRMGRSKPFKINHVQIDEALRRTAKSAQVVPSTEEAAG